MMFGLKMMDMVQVIQITNNAMNEEMLKDQITQLQTDLDIAQKRLRNVERDYNELIHICLGIHYARIAMNEVKVIEGLSKIDAFFREENTN